MRRLLLATLLLTAPGLASAATIWDESIDGDLSGVGAAPTELTLAAGTNTVIGTIGNNGNTGAVGGQDADYFYFTVPAGATVTSLTVDSYTFAPSNPGSSFAGYVNGLGFAGQGAGNVDDFLLFNAASGDITASLGGPYGVGTHSFWLQETADTVVSYALTFTLVPEPSAGLLMLGAGLALVGLRRSER